VNGSSSSDILSLPSNSKTNGWSLTSSVSSANSSPFDPPINDLDYLERPLNDIDDDDSDEESMAVANSGVDSCRPNGSAKLSTVSGGSSRGTTTKESSKRSGKSINSAMNVSKDASSLSR